MKKQSRQIELLINSLNEVYRIEQVIESLPRGYISVKKIAGHVYYYRQWREKDKIISNYVPETFLNGVKQKIVIRKENEQLLKIVKKDLAKAIKNVLKEGSLNESQIELLKQGAEYDNLKPSEKEEFALKQFENCSDEVKKDIPYYVDGTISYNNLLLKSWEE